MKVLSFDKILIFLGKGAVLLLSWVDLIKRVKILFKISSKKFAKNEVFLSPKT